MILKPTYHLPFIDLVLLSSFVRNIARRISVLKDLFCEFFDSPSLLREHDHNPFGLLSAGKGEGWNRGVLSGEVPSGSKWCVEFEC